MDNELIAVSGARDIAEQRPPTIVLAEAKRAAAALRDIVSQKPRPVIFGGKQYLCFEDWQTIGRFYGVTARVDGSSFLELGTAKGWESVAVAVRADGQVLSRAEAMCMDDEANWRGKPLFQLRSMAQTRAAAKALRNVLSWVAVLAGYEPTPAEEMTGTEKPSRGRTQDVPDHVGEEPRQMASEAQIKALFALCNKLGIKDQFAIKTKVSRLAGIPEPEVLNDVRGLTRKQASTVIETLQGQVRK